MVLPSFIHVEEFTNDLDDMESNEDIAVPETGFDVLLKKNFQPFFSFINGPIEIKSLPYELEFIDEFGATQTFKRRLKHISPFGLAWINIFEK